MNKKRTYIHPRMQVLEFKNSQYLLTASPINSKFFDDPKYIWDNEGAS